jgi:predicted  nucleic acid-binding Zn-ribbon protein
MNEAIQLSKQRLQDNFDKVSRKLVALDTAAQRLTKDNQALKERNLFLEKQCVNADKRVWIYKKAITDNLAQSRENELGMVKEIKELKAKIKQLEG